jgi:hypothetical protein
MDVGEFEGSEPPGRSGQVEKVGFVEREKGNRVGTRRRITIRKGKTGREVPGEGEQRRKDLKNGCESEAIARNRVVVPPEPEWPINS